MFAEPASQPSRPQHLGDNRQNKLPEVPSGWTAVCRTVILSIRSEIVETGRLSPGYNKKRYAPIVHHRPVVASTRGQPPHSRRKSHSALYDRNAATRERCCLVCYLCGRVSPPTFTDAPITGSIVCGVAAPLNHSYSCRRRYLAGDRSGRADSEGSHNDSYPARRRLQFRIDGDCCAESRHQRLSETARERRRSS